jgi:putative transposase
MPEPRLIVTQRKMPHWRLEGSVYFATWRLRRDIPDLSMEERMLVASALRHFNRQRYELYAWVVMNDHGHVVFRPSESFAMSGILHSWKSFTTHQLQRKYERIGAVWVDETWDRIVRDNDELLEKCTYVLNNPRKRWPDVVDYPACGWE